MGVRRSSARSAFTLVELLVAIAVIGVLIGLLLPAVQASREASRRTACLSNLHNQALALQQHHDERRRFPAGRRWTGNNDTSWYLEVLPQLEQRAAAQRYDWSQPWSDGSGNLAVANTTIAVLRCPSSLIEFEGDCDYGGLLGSSLTSVQWATAFNNGVLTDEQSSMGRRISFSSITDGSSQTIAIAESADRPEETGRWIVGLNCFSHDIGSINGGDGGEIHSWHPGGALAAFADGSIRFLHQNTDPFVVGALCTRNLGEIVDGSVY